MEAYTFFSEYYELFMDNVPYVEWKNHIVKVLKANGITDGLVLDLGCGTGSMTRLLAAEGYDMTGVDGSYEMLIKAQEVGGDILYLCQDIRGFELYGTVRAVTAVCDVMNYVTEYDELVKVFSLVNNYLDKEGIFIFDLNTPYKYEKLLADKTFSESREEAAFIWDNFYDEESKINEYELTLFGQREDGLFERNIELHYERCYTLSEIKSALKEAGMEFLGAFSGYSDIEYDEKSDADRMVIVAREGHQEGKYYE